MIQFQSAYKNKKNRQLEEEEQLGFQAKEKWKKIKNAIIGVQQFKTCDAKKINSQRDLAQSIDQYQKQNNQQQKQNNQQQNTEQIDTIVEQQADSFVEPNKDENLDNWNYERKDSKQDTMLETYFNLKRMNIIDNDGYLDFLRTQQLMSACEKGGQKSLKRIIELMNNDPRKYLIDSTNPSHLMNKKDQTGQFPLYVAAKNGNLDIVKFLIQQQALTRQTYQFENKEKEEAIDVAFRWNHWAIVKFMLDEIEYDKQTKSRIEKRISKRKKKKQCVC